MPSKEEQKRRKALARAWQQEQRDKVEASLPVPFEHLKPLFDYVDVKFGEEGCDGTLLFTHEFIRTSTTLQGKEDEVIRWLVEHGGGCDCEVLANVEDVWEYEPATQKWRYKG